jgi:hypothetical protein
MLLSANLHLLHVFLQSARLAQPVARAKRVVGGAAQVQLARLA